MTTIDEQKKLLSDFLKVSIHPDLEEYIRGLAKDIIADADGCGIALFKGEDYGEYLLGIKEEAYQILEALDESRH